MKMSDAGLYLLQQREGVRYKAYKDVKGIWTIGVGHTGLDVHEGLVWTPQQVHEALKNDVEIAENAINKYVKVTLMQYQFDALCSFVFNVGVRAFMNSTLLKVLNKGDFDGAAAQLDRWHIPKEIIGRRDSEKAQFLGH